VKSAKRLAIPMMKTKRSGRLEESCSRSLIGDLQMAADVQA
jgi:hypothetical protein